jgi:predicted amidohydrolase YtcJ
VIRPAALSTVLLAAALGCGRGAPPPTSDRATLVLVGGEVVTNLPDQPRVEAVAVRGSRILAIGDAAAMAAVTGPDTRVIDLGGRTVTVGLTDGHCHLYGLGVAEEQVNLRGLPSEQAAVAAAVAAAAGRAPGEWIEGRGWDQNPWGGAFPTRASLDAALGDRPVALRRVDGHAVWVSSAVLRLAKITKATPDPAGGKIIRDASGEPTGVLIDQAMMLIDGLAPPIDDAVRARRIRAAAAAAIAVGLTGVHEMGIDDDTVAVVPGRSTPSAVGCRCACTRTSRAIRPPAAALRASPAAAGRRRLLRADRREVLRRRRARLARAPRCSPTTATIPASAGCG